MKRDSRVKSWDQQWDNKHWQYSTPSINKAKRVSCATRIVPPIAPLSIIPYLAALVAWCNPIYRVDSYSKPPIHSIHSRRQICSRYTWFFKRPKSWKTPTYGTQEDNLVLKYDIPLFLPAALGWQLHKPKSPHAIAGCTGYKITGSVDLASDQLLKVYQPILVQTYLLLSSHSKQHSLPFP